MNGLRQIGPFSNPASADADLSPRYVGCWLAPKFYNPAGTLTYHLLTVANGAGITSNAWTGVGSPAGGSASWLTAGTLVRVRNNGGTIPTGLSVSTAYYAGRPDSDKVSLHTTQADALADTNRVAFSGGTSNTDIYAAEWLDVSGQGNHLTIGPNNNNLSFYGTAGYGSAASSGSVDTAAGVLTLSAAITARLAWPANSWMFAARVIRGTASPGRSFWGCGNSGTADGPRMNVNSSNTDKIDVQLFHSGGTVLSLGTSASSPLSSATGSHIALAVDGPARRGYLYVNGVPDLTVFDKVLSTAGAITWPAVLRIGGATAANAQASNWRECHLMAFAGSLPGNIGDVVARLADSRFHRVLEKEC